MMTQTSAGPVRTTLAFLKGTNGLMLVFFSSSSEMCLKRDAVLLKKERLLASSFLQADSPVLPLGMSTPGV